MYAELIRDAMYTVLPHRLPHGLQCGTWHCLVIRDRPDGKVLVREMKIEDGRWVPAMTTYVWREYVRPLAVQLDLFGAPIDPAP